MRKITLVLAVLALSAVSVAAVNIPAVEIHSPWRFSPLGASDLAPGRLLLAKAALFVPVPVKNPAEIVIGKLGDAFKVSQNFWCAALGGGFAGTVHPRSRRGVCRPEGQVDREIEKRHCLIEKRRSLLPGGMQLPCLRRGGCS